MEQRPCSAAAILFYNGAPTHLLQSGKESKEGRWAVRGKVDGKKGRGTVGGKKEGGR